MPRPWSGGDDGIRANVIVPHVTSPSMEAALGRPGAPGAITGEHSDRSVRAARRHRAGGRIPRRARCRVRDRADAARRRRDEVPPLTLDLRARCDRLNPPRDGSMLQGETHRGRRPPPVGGGVRCRRTRGRSVPAGTNAAESHTVLLLGDSLLNQTAPKLPTARWRGTVSAPTSSTSRTRVPDCSTRTWSHADRQDRRSPERRHRRDRVQWQLLRVPGCLRFDEFFQQWSANLVEIVDYVESRGKHVVLVLPPPIRADLTVGRGATSSSVSGRRVSPLTDAHRARELVGSAGRHQRQLPAGAVVRRSLRRAHAAHGAQRRRRASHRGRRAPNRGMDRGGAAPVLDRRPVIRLALTRGGIELLPVLGQPSQGYVGHLGSDAGSAGKRWSSSSCRRTSSWPWGTCPAT